jgi:hypothetical protein
LNLLNLYRNQLSNKEQERIKKLLPNTRIKF